MALADGKPTAITGTAAATADVARITFADIISATMADMMQTADARDRDLLRRCIDELKR